MFPPAHKTHRLLIGGLTVLALLLLPALATPAERIVVKGAASGSHLRLTVEGSSIVVTGIMAGPPQGCRLVRVTAGAA